MSLHQLNCEYLQAGNMPFDKYISERYEPNVFLSHETVKDSLCKTYKPI